MKSINPKLIKCDPAFHARAELKEEIVTDYLEDMKRGDEFPPITVFWNGKHEAYILADGFHRMEAWRRMNETAYVPCQVKLGTEEDARWFAICANKDNGLRRSNADKRKVVELALMHPRGTKLSNRLIARFTGVSHEYVRIVRNDLEMTGNDCSRRFVKEQMVGLMISVTSENLPGIPPIKPVKTAVYIAMVVADSAPITRNRTTRPARNSA